MASILITLGTHLSQSPRAQRVVGLLSQQHQHDLIISYPKLNHLFSSLDADIADHLKLELLPFSDLTHQSRSSIIDRARFKMGRSAACWLRWSTPWALAYGTERALKIAKKIKPILHYGFNEVGSYVSYKLLSHCRVAADFEDYYSQDLLASASAERPHRLLVEVESQLCRKAELVTTASKELSDAFKDAHQCTPPYVFYNMFTHDAITPFIDISHLPTLSDQALNAVWFSKTVGPGRGLEDLCVAIAGLRLPRPIHLYLIGSCSNQYQQVLQSLFHHQVDLPAHSGNQIVFVPFLSPAELDAYLPCFDIGLALEQPEPLSRNLTTTNKFFHYITSGLAVIASPTRGQVEATALCSDAVSLTKGFRSQDIANALTDLSLSSLIHAKLASREYSKGTCNSTSYDDALLTRILSCISSNN